MNQAQTCRTPERNQWQLVQNSTGRVIRTFATEDDAWFYQHHDSLYPVSEYAIRCLARTELDTKRKGKG